MVSGSADLRVTSNFGSKLIWFVARGQTGSSSPSSRFILLTRRVAYSVVASINAHLVVTANSTTTFLATVLLSVSSRSTKPEDEFTSYVPSVVLDATPPHHNTSDYRNHGRSQLCSLKSLSRYYVTVASPSHYAVSSIDGSSQSELAKSTSYSITSASSSHYTISNIDGSSQCQLHDLQTGAAIINGGSRMSCSSRTLTHRVFTGVLRPLFFRSRISPPAEALTTNCRLLHMTPLPPLSLVRLVSPSSPIYTARSPSVQATTIDPQAVVTTFIFRLERLSTFSGELLESSPRLPQVHVPYYASSKWTASFWCRLRPGSVPWPLPASSTEIRYSRNEMAEVQGPSMLLTLNLTGDVILAEHVSHRFGKIGLGDVALVRSPTDPMKMVTKRVLGLEGHRLSFYADPLVGDDSVNVVF
ncbi:hypothetical protein Bca52824_006315 [Brassica carinata]|uniref:Peptidase S26 domain-containing protein n=1 Tax=Brassica carinata TaxID=52824 RepID=A0A8X7WT37_BRACI|nr:hypothetical protein Bca52824_006315 [Brassica carinata]